MKSSATAGSWVTQRPMSNYTQRWQNLVAILQAAAPQASTDILERRSCDGSVTAGLLAVALSRLNAAQIAHITNARGVTLLLIASFTMLIVLAINTIRWVLIGQAMSLKMCWLDAFRWILIGQFFNQFFPSSVGGDIVRGAIAGHSTGDLPATIISIALDRLIGLSTLILILAIGQILMIRSLSDPRLYLLAIVVLRSHSAQSQPYWSWIELSDTIFRLRPSCDAALFPGSQAIDLPTDTFDPRAIVVVCAAGNQSGPDRIDFKSIWAPAFRC